MERSIYTYTIVPEPFDEVVRLLQDDPALVLQSATDHATDEARRVRSDLRVDVGEFEIGRSITVEVGELTPLGAHAASLPLRWRATDSAALFPSLEAKLEVSLLSARAPRTQLSLLATYEPPLSVVGAIGDALVGKRIADVALHHFLTDVAHRLTTVLESRRQVVSSPRGTSTSDVQPSTAGTAR